MQMVGAAAGKLMRKARERVGVETDKTHQLARALMRGAFRSCRNSPVLR